MCSIPLFEEETGYSVKVVAVGTGQALEMGQEGNADVLLVHAPGSEKTFMADGYGTDRFLVMHNDFIIVGPAADPAGIKGGAVAVDAFTKIAEAGAPFVSRGDKSGTNTKELALWKAAGLDPATEKPAWYIESGQGMGATLTIASEKAAYTLTDRATYLANKGQPGSRDPGGEGQCPAERLSRHHRESGQVAQGQLRGRARVRQVDDRAVDSGASSVSSAWRSTASRCSSRMRTRPTRILDSSDFAGIQGTRHGRLACRVSIDTTPMAMIFDPEVLQVTLLSLQISALGHGASACCWVCRLARCWGWASFAAGRSCSA